MTQHADKPNVQNTSRRTFLTVGLTGAAAFILGKIFGEDLAKLFESEPQYDGEIKKLGNFTVIESDDEVVFKDRSGEDIFVVDKASFRE